MMVADGVSSSARGAQSAALAIAECSALFRESRCGSPEEMRSLLIAVNRRVAAQFAGTGLCSFVAALWDAGAGRVTIANAGDSPAYFWDYRRLVRLGHLDQTAPAFRQGMLQSFLTQAIGQMTEVKPNIVEYIPPLSGGILCVTSDGVLERQLEEFLKGFGSRLNQSAVAEFCRHMRVRSRDDTTLAAVRLGPPHQSDVELGLTHYQTHPAAERARLLLLAGEAAYVSAGPLARAFWSEADEARARNILDLLARHGGDFTRVEWTAFLDRCARERRALLPAASRAASRWINRRD
jgi:serine/threonine protein phosphatase PrpC